jgi:hypothetical protein
MTIQAKLGRCAAVALTITVVSGASAQNITPSHVYQVVDNVNGELALMHEANGSKAKMDKKAPALTKRRPRHVIQKAREVFSKVQELRKINGLATNPVPGFPVREVKPADVKQIVAAILKNVRDLRPKFKIAKPSPNVALASGKNPTDVYGNLALSGRQVDGLGIPRVVPNGVHQLAMTIIGDLEMIRAKRGLTGKIAMESGAKRKKPKHVWNRGYELLTGLKSLTTSNPNFAIPGGVVLPNKRSGKIRPGHVMDLLNNVLAEISAIKVKVGANTPTKIAEMPSGKTPSNVFDAVSTAIGMVKSLSAKQS